MSWEVRTMQSKTSCFNKTIFRKHVTRFWPVWGAYLAIWLLAMPVSLLSQRDYLLRSPVGVQQSVLNSIQSGVVMSFIFSVLMAMAVWSFLYNSRSASGAACLPVTRKAQFNSAVLAGLLPLAAANVLTFLLTLLAEASLGLLHLPSLLTWLAATLLHLLFYYGFATFCAMLTGNIIILPAVYAVLNFVGAGAQVLLDGVIKCFLYGVEELGGSWLYWLSPTAQLMTNNLQGVTVIDDVRGVYTTVGWTYTGWGWSAIYAVVGALLLWAAWALLRRRRMETAGDTVAVRALKPVFRWCMGVFGALCFADMMLYVFGLSGGETQRAVFAVTAVYLVVGAFLGWFIGEMLIRRSFRIFRGGRRLWGGWALCCIILLAALTATELDIFGIERYIPAEEKVVAVSVDAAGERAYVESREGIAEATSLHRAIIDHKPAQDQCDQKAFFLNGWSGNFQTVSVRVNYYLKNGCMVSRSYLLAHLYDAAGDDASAVQALLNSPEAVKNRKARPFEFTRENVSGGSISVEMPAADCAAAAGYDSPEDYALCELAGYTRSEAAALSDELRERALRDALDNFRYLYDSGYYADSYAYGGFGYGAAGYDYAERDLSVPMKGGEIDWDRIWLSYSLMLTKQEAWELWSECILPDLAGNALGRVWVLQGSDYAATACAASVSIDAREPDGMTYMPVYDGAPAAASTEAHYYGFSTVPTVDSVRTNAWLAKHGVTVYTIGEIRAAQAK